MDEHVGDPNQHVCTPRGCPGTTGVINGAEKPIVRLDTVNLTSEGYTSSVHLVGNSNSGFSSIPRINLSPFTKDFRGEEHQMSL